MPEKKKATGAKKKASDKQPRSEKKEQELRQMAGEYLYD